MAPTKQIQERRALRPKQASVAYGVGRVTLYKWMNSGWPASINRGGARLIPRRCLGSLASTGCLTPPLFLTRPPRQKEEAPPTRGRGRG